MGGEVVGGEGRDGPPRPKSGGMFSMRGSSRGNSPAFSRPSSRGDVRPSTMGSNRGSSRGSSRGSQRGSPVDIGTPTASNAGIPTPGGSRPGTSDSSKSAQRSKSPTAFFSKVGNAVGGAMRRKSVVDHGPPPLGSLSSIPTPVQRYQYTKAEWAKYDVPEAGAPR